MQMEELSFSSCFGKAEGAQSRLQSLALFMCWWLLPSNLLSNCFQSPLDAPIASEPCSPGAGKDPRELLLPLCAGRPQWCCS